MNLDQINRGGWLSGRKTHLAAGLMVMALLSKYLTGDMTLFALVKALGQVLTDPTGQAAILASTFRDAFAGYEQKKIAALTTPPAASDGDWEQA